MIEVRNAGVKGLGIFATREIARGTRLLAEKAVIKVSSESQVFTASRRLHQHDVDRLMSLTIHPVQKATVLSWIEGLWHALALHRQTTTIACEPFAPFYASLLRYPGLLAAFRNNNFDIGYGQQALFGDICRINHSCVPNAQGNFNTNLNRFTIHATQPIDKDQEVTISYLSEHGALKEHRRGRLRQQYGFLCECPACDATSKRGQTGEDRRVHLQERLHEFAENANVGNVTQPRAELAITRHMIEMYESEGIAGRELATMYLSAADLAHKLRHYEDVQILAQRGLQLELECLGADSDIFQESQRRVQTLLGAIQGSA